MANGSARRADTKSATGLRSLVVPPLASGEGGSEMVMYGLVVAGQGGSWFSASAASAAPPAASLPMSERGSGDGSVCSERKRARR